MSLKFLHSSDLHIGSGRNFPDYLSRQRIMLEGIFKIADEKQCDLIFIVGDLFHRDTLREEERNLALDVISKQLKSGKTIILLEGNHDYYTQDCTLIECFESLSNLSDNLYIIEKKPKLLKFPKYDLAVCAIPCQQNLTRKKIEAIVEKAYNKLKDKPKYFVVALHESIKGSKTDTGFPLEGAKLPKLPYVTCWLLGDIHRYQELLPNAWYSGSPCQTKFDEKLPKGVVFYNDGKRELISIKGVKRLVTVKQGDSIPSDAIVRYERSDLFDNEALPDNVIKVVETIPDREAIKMDDLNDITAGLPEFLSKKGFTKERQQEGLNIINQLRHSKLDED